MKTKLIVSALLLVSLPASAEDPFLGIVKAIKCVGCRPGWVDIVVHDPIDVRDFEIAVKDVDYYKVVSPLPGKKIHDKDGACFYWFELPKGAAAPAAPTAPAVKTAPKPKPPPPPPSDSMAPSDSVAAVSDSGLVPPPALPVPTGPAPVQSRCVPYVKAAPPPSVKKKGED